MSEYVTAADLKSWDPFGDRGLRPAGETRKKPRKARVKKEQQSEPKPEPKPNAKLTNVRSYMKGLEAGTAVNKALEIVTALGYDLSKNSASQQRRKGWMTFCRLIQLSCPSYSVRGISDALTVPGAPARETLDWMFEVCGKDNPHGDSELKKKLDL